MEKPIRKCNTCKSIISSEKKKKPEIDDDKPEVKRIICSKCNSIIKLILYIDF